MTVLSPTVKQHWLVNEYSGNGEGERLLRDLSQLGVPASPIDFQSLDVQIAATPSDCQIVVAGGDGTFSSVMGRPCVGERPIACVPLGTANDLTREIGVSQRLRNATNQDLPSLLAPLVSKPFAVWEARIGDRCYPFANYASIGFEAAVVDDFARWREENRWSGRLTNRIAYTAFGTLHSLASIRGLEVVTGEGEHLPCKPTTGLIITNIRSHLGLGISNGESSPHDDIIECVSVPTVFGFASMIGASVGLLRAPDVLARSRSLTIRGIPANTPLQLDGERSEPVEGGELTIVFRHFVNLCTAE